jgi:hypothetical protein
LPIPTLTAAQLFRSHIVSCLKCKELDTKTKKHRLCPVGSLLLSRAQAESLKEPSSKPTNFPFVAKLLERVMAHIGTEWIEVRVVDLSISAAYPYQKFNEETGKVEWKTAAPKVIGYEVTSRQGKFYVNSSNVKKLPKSGGSVAVAQVVVAHQERVQLPPNLTNSRVRIKHS